MPSPVILLTVLIFKNCAAKDPYMFGLIVNVINRSGFSFFSRKKILKKIEILSKIEILLLEKINFFTIIFFLLKNFL